MTARSAKRRRRSEPAKVVQAALVRLGRFCIGCGCCDAVSCAGGCGWLLTDGAIPVGVCTECPAYRPVFTMLKPRQLKAIYFEKVAKAEEWA